MKRVQRDTEAAARRVNRRALLLGGGMTAMFAALGLRMRIRLQCSRKESAYRLMTKRFRVKTI